MKKHYDFSKGKKNPYARRLKRQITIRLDEDTLAYFKQLAEDAEVPYQTLINHFLRDWRAGGSACRCGGRRRKPAASSRSAHAREDLREPWSGRAHR